MSICVTVAAMSELQESVRAWLRSVLDETGLTASALARSIGTSTTTLTRVLNDPLAKHVLSTRTIDAIARTTGISGPGAPPSGQARMPEHEIDGLQLKTQTGDVRIDDAVSFLCSNENGLTPWRLNTRALEGMGYLPGDVVIVDLNATADTGDVVVAQVNQGKSADTIFRIYAKPFVSACAIDRVARAPLVVDDIHVSICGVVVAMFRPRRGHLKAA
jgi:lambda repressor-like predicted transcriptional regulator